ncbi:multinuclear nonheme iron-dependent oxidase, partial [Streptomyces sp. BE20]|uniref:multinuclear nonheme iron-dependent oxidase n=1 Tax=Streptomyces sp. BE20 TaxID=3002525 RepID=UPI003FA79787
PPPPHKPPHQAWPDHQLTQGQLHPDLVQPTRVRLQNDVANHHTNPVNHGIDPAPDQDPHPLDAHANLHVAGGTIIDGGRHHTPPPPVTQPVQEVLAELCAPVAP